MTTLSLRIILLFTIILYSVNSYATLSTPAFLMPSSGLNNAPPDIELSWTQVPFATGYEVQISPDQSFILNVISDTTNTISYWANSLTLGSTYYWRVRALQNAPPDSSAWSSANYFTVISKVNLLLPLDGQLNQGASVFFDWTAIQNVTSYKVQLDTTSSFNSAFFIDTMTSNSYLDLTLHFGLKYYWRVSAVFTNGSNAWSDIRTFTTENIINISSPNNNATGLPTSLYLVWTGLSGASKYNVQFDTTSTFTSPELHSAMSNFSSYSANDLLFGTKYYCRVRGINDVDTSAWSIISSFTIANEPQINQPANGSTGLITRQTFIWSVLTGMSYIFELDTMSTFSSPYDTVINAGAVSSLYLQDLHYSTKFYWRVCAYHSRDTSDWSSVYNFTTFHTVNPVSPAMNAQNRHCFLEFQWDVLDTDDNFNIQVDTSPNFNSTYLLDSSFFNGLYFGQPGQMHMDKTYYWRVRSFNDRDTSDWSILRTFSTAGFLNLLIPSNNSIVTNTNVNLNWTNLVDIVDFDYQLDTSPNFNSMLLQNGTIFNNNYATALNLYFGNKYYWHVRARNNLDTVRWSATSSFTIRDFVTLNAPSDNSINNYVKPLLSWTGFENAGGFICEYDTVNTFNSPSFTAVNLTANSMKIYDLLYSQWYYWRVKAYNLNDTSGWSAVYHFKTIAKIALTSPANNSTGLMPPVLLDCAYSDGSKYEFYCSTDSLFQSNVIMQLDSVSGTSLNSISLGTKYYWKARLIDATDTSDWSNVWNFTTMALPSVPVLTSPVNSGSVTPSTSVSLYWNGVANALTYDVQFDTISSFNTTPVFSVATFSRYVGFLTLGKTYYWRVRAVNAAGNSPWSTTWSFSVVTVGIDDNEMSQNNLYPNPVVDFLYFEKELKGSWIITDISGKTIISGDNTGMMIDLRMLSSGLYILKPEDGTAIRFVKK